MMNNGFNARPFSLGGSGAPHSRSDSPEHQHQQDSGAATPQDPTHVVTHLRYGDECFYGKVIRSAKKYGTFY